MKEVFLVVSDSGASTFLPDKFETSAHVLLDGAFVAADVAKRIKEKIGLDFGRARLVIAASYKKTIIRVAQMREFNHKRSFLRKKIAESDAWEVVKSVFPFGHAINEDTHLFDVSLFGNKKYVCYGLPVDICENLAELGKELTGSLHKVSRLETIENLMFAGMCNGSRIVIFPQDDGFRVLAIKDGLPENAFFISNHPKWREAEFERILDNIGGNMAICAPSFMTMGAGDDLEWVSKYGLGHSCETA